MAAKKSKKETSEVIKNIEELLKLQEINQNFDALVEEINQLKEEAGLEEKKYAAKKHQYDKHYPFLEKVQKEHDTLQEELVIIKKKIEENEEKKKKIKTIKEFKAVNKEIDALNRQNAIKENDLLTKAEELEFKKTKIEKISNAIEEIKEVIKEYRVASKKVYPNSLNDDEFLKLRLSKKYKNLTAQQFADELNKIPQKDRTIGYKTVNGKDFTKGNVDNITYKLDIQKEVGQGVKNLSKSQQKILTNAFPEYAGKWDFKANKYGMNFSDVGKDVWNILRHTADDKKKWPKGVKAKSRLWHKAYRSAIKGEDEGRFRILHPEDGKIMSGDKFTK